MLIATIQLDHVFYLTHRHCLFLNLCLCGQLQNGLRPPQGAEQSQGSAKHKRAANTKGPGKAATPLSKEPTPHTSGPKQTHPSKLHKVNFVQPSHTLNRWRAITQNLKTVLRYMKLVYRCLFHPARPSGCLDSYRALTAPRHHPGDGGARRGLGGPVTARGPQKRVAGPQPEPCGAARAPAPAFSIPCPRPCKQGGRTTLTQHIGRSHGRPSSLEHSDPGHWVVPGGPAAGRASRGRASRGRPPHPEGPGRRPAPGGSAPAGLRPGPRPGWGGAAGGERGPGPRPRRVRAPTSHGRDPVRCPNPDMLTRPNFLRASPPSSARTPVRPRSSGRPRPEAPAARAPQAWREARARPRSDRSPRKIPPENPRVGTPEGKSDKREPGAPTCKLSERPPPSPPPPQKGFKSVRAQRSQPHSRPRGWGEPAGRRDGGRCSAHRPRPLPHASGRGRARRRCHGDAPGLCCPAQPAGGGDFRTRVSPPPRPRGAVALATLRASAAPT